MSFDFNPDSQERVSEMEPPPERISRFNILVFAAFGLLVVVWLAWNPLVTASKTAWARHHVREALASMSGNDLVGAVPHLLTARRWAPEDVEVIRAVVEYLKITQTDQATLSQQLRLLAEKQPLTAEEQVLLGKSLVAVGKTADARGVYDKLNASANAAPKKLELLSEVLSAEGRVTEAAEVSRRSLMKNEDTPESRLQLAVQDQFHPHDVARGRARSELWQSAMLDNTLGMAAIQRLALDPALTLAEARRLLDLVDHHPHQDLNSHLHVVSALLLLQPEQRGRLLDAEISRFREEQSGNLPDLARWLAQHREYERLLKIVPRHLAVSSRPLYASMIEALAGQRRWQEIKELLKEKKPPVSDTLAAIWLADVESHLQPDLSESRRLLATAIEVAVAKVNAEELTAAAVLAERLGLADLALKSVVALAPLVPEKEIESLQHAFELACGQKDAAAQLHVSRRLHELRPGSSIFAERLDYLRLVLGVEVESVVFARQDHAEASAEHIPQSLLRALAAYRLGDKNAAKASMNELPDITRLPPGQRAVTAGLLFATGDPARAYQVAERVPEALLLDEERQFLNRAR